jgi:myosin heavy subunit
MYLNFLRVAYTMAVRTACLHDYTNQQRCLTALGMAAEAQEALFRVVAAVMHLGNLEFEPLDIAVSAKVLQLYSHVRTDFVY